MLASLVTLLMLSNCICQSVQQVDAAYDAYVRDMSTLEMSIYIQKTYFDLTSNDQKDVASEAEKVIEFSVELVLSSFPEFSQNAETFMKVISELLQTSFREVNDDILVEIKADDVVLDGIEKVLRQQNKFMVCPFVLLIILTGEVAKMQPDERYLLMT
eukprot:TRINITY_DN10358_c0_g1_i6.p2 TRINITY_DN10358_c0_g1~~TRINITY_DN10358_c0_g1_i6.p2  ORF type:complete len:158 (+),score=16.72 TRINITY_DN10358_c0_g1_i6:146-619(+)